MPKPQYHFEATLVGESRKGVPCGKSVSGNHNSVSSTFHLLQTERRVEGKGGRWYRESHQFMEGTLFKKV